VIAVWPGKSPARKYKKVKCWGAEDGGHAPQTLRVEVRTGFQPAPARLMARPAPPYGLCCAQSVSLCSAVRFIFQMVPAARFARALVRF